ncbi:unnamed protein product [Owenia fusiformis]|uniref:Uncharacterized protein n=1 Tax=Owenia fusiformis TaxID=6347 RepID=A0A8J1Y6X6_OWEFU|nr:unnamed protein product [Owenia fusiformis]
MQARVVWNTAGSWADDDLQIFQPFPSPQFFEGGHKAQANMNELETGIITIADDTGGELGEPRYFTLMWNDGGADMDGAIWRVHCVDGYVPLGDVVFGHEDAYPYPLQDTVRCVRNDTASPCTFGARVWTDVGTGAEKDVSIWAIRPNNTQLSTFFMSSNNHSTPPTNTPWCLNNNNRNTVLTPQNK